MSTSRKTRAITKILSANNTGETGAHQAGILVPKEPEILDFFPPLGKTEKNPRYNLPFYDDSETRWEFAFIYYNNRFFGGTRNEFRLTRMTPYMKINGLKPGDELTLEHGSEGKRYVRFKRARASGMGADGILRLGFSWKVLEI